jgi:outer membrane lipoprotein-sorting protein
LTALCGTRSKSPNRWLTAAISVAGAVLLLSAGAEAKTGKVPLPHLRPQIAGKVAAQAPAQIPAVQPLNPATAPATPSHFSAADQKTLANISAYFNSFQTMAGQFIQFGPHGEQSEGVFSISRPGKIRFHYSPPALLDVISDGHNVAIRDNRAMTQDLYPLSKTPLRYLLANAVDLTSDKIVDQVRRERDLIALVIIEKSSFAQGKITLIFDPQSYALKQWIVTDAQGLNTSVAIYNTTVGAKPDWKLFTIDYFANKH